MKRRVVYVATGNAYADPVQPMTDAIVAMDIDTGKVKWSYQGTTNDNWLGGCGARNGGNLGCPEVQGPDFDFSASPLLATLTTAGNRQILVVPQKSGVAHALDPDTGDLIWKYRFGQGSGLGGQWGATSDGETVYFGVGDGQSQNPGGLRAYSTKDGSVLWQFDTNKEFTTVNGVKATGASIDGSPLIVAGGMIFVNSGYGGIAARPGNVFMAFGN